MVHVALINANLIHSPAVAPYALDILGTVLSSAGFEISILDLTPEAPFWEKSIERFFSQNHPDFVGVSLRNLSDVYFPSLHALPEGGSFLSSHKKVIDEISLFFPREKIILGGVGFSIAPEIILKRLNIRYGVVGATETIFSILIERLSRGEFVDDIPFVSQLGKKYFVGEIPAFDKPINRKDFVDNQWYYKHGEFVGLRTTNGCVMPCSYCPEPRAKGNRFQSQIKNVIHEIDQLVDLGVKDIHLNDSEINIPLLHSKEVAKAIIERGYPNSLQFWSYAQITPFDEELARLWGGAGMKGILFGADHTDPGMLKKLGKWYTPNDIRQTIGFCKDFGIATMIELLYGMYGETEQKIKNSIDFAWSLEPHTIGVTVGIGIVPGTPLAKDEQIIKAISIADEQKRIAEYGVYCRGTPLEDPTFLVDPCIHVPEIYDIIRNHVGVRINKIMVPTADSLSATNNQLVNSERISNMRKKGQKGSHWYWYPTQFEEMVK